MAKAIVLLKPNLLILLAIFQENIMKAKSRIHKLVETAPVPKAHGHMRHIFTNVQAAIFFAVVQTILGIACILFTEQIHHVFPIVLGIFMVTLGICDILRSIVTKEYRQKETKLISHGIVVWILGFVILFHHQNADQIIGAIWGVIGLYKGSEALNTAIFHRCAKLPFIRSFLHGLIDILLGITLLVDPMTAVEHHVFILGIELIVLGVQSVVETKNLSE